MAKKGLGRGFSSLIPTEMMADEKLDLSLGLESENDKLKELKLSDISPDPDQPRRNFDKEKLEDLSNSIKIHGVLQPIVVIEKGLKFVIVAGERRYRASKLAGLEKIPAIVRDLSDQNRLELSLIENIQRDNLNVLETAEAYQKLREQFNLTALVDAVYPKTEEITALMDAVFTKSDSYDSTSMIPETRTDEEISDTPEKNNKNLPTKIAVGALAAAMAIGGIAGLNELTGRTASAEITIHNPEKAREQICDTQATLEESLGLPKSTSYDSFQGCEVTADMVTKTEEELKPGDKVKITVTTNAFGEAAGAEKVKDQDS